MHHPLGVDENDVFLRQTEAVHQMQGGQRRRAGAEADQFRGADVASGQLQGVDQAGGGDDGGAVLVVMEHRDVHLLLQGVLDDEALRGLDVFQIDAAEGGAEAADGGNQLLRAAGVHLDVHGVHVGEALEEHRLAFHDRLCRQRAEIAHAENGGAIGDHGDEIAARGIVEDAVGILRDGLHRRRHAGRVGEREIVARRHGFGGGDGHFARGILGMISQGLRIGDGLALLRRRHFPDHGFESFLLLA